MNRLTDCELVERYNAGEKRAADVLLRRHRGIAYWVASEYPSGWYTHDDLEQEGLIAISKAIGDYEPDAGLSLRNFLFLCVRRQIISALKKASRGKHSPLNGAVNFEWKSTTDGSAMTLFDVLPGPASLDPLSQIISKEQMAELYNFFAGRLSEMESDSIRLRLEGYDYEEIAEAIGVSCKSVDNALMRARQKLAAHMQLSAA
jgi:RNA polymerase sporulation-specific sigma factor